MSIEHDLKCDKVYFQAVDRGDKPFELRYNDRNYQKGDYLRLREMDGIYRTGKVITRKVLCVVSGKPWLTDNYVCLGLGIDDREN